MEVHLNELDKIAEQSGYNGSDLTKLHEIHQYILNYLKRTRLSSIDSLVENELEYYGINEEISEYIDAVNNYLRVNNFYNS